MDTSTEKHNFPHSKSEKEEDILEQLCIWKTQNISLDLERICQHFRMEKRDIVVCLKRMQKEGYLEKIIAGQEIQLTDYGLSVGNDYIYRHKCNQKFSLNHSVIRLYNKFKDSGWNLFSLCSLFS